MIDSTKVDTPTEVTRKAEKSISIILIIGLGIGTLGLIGYPISIVGIGLRLAFIAILLAIAAFITGFFTGTLFGMPKRNDEVNSDYALNNSLVEISEWLTKIIVGLGLVNLKQIPNYLMDLGTYISEASGSKGQSLDVFAMCIVVYFSIFGLYIGYNYMRLVLSQKYKLADDNILRKEIIKKEIEAKELKSTIQEKQVQTQTLLQEINQPNVEEKNSFSDSYVSEMRIKAELKLKNGLLLNNDDPQKDQWGKLALNNNRELKAKVKEIARGVYRIYIKIMSTNPAQFPLEEGETVLFALHKSFGEPPFRYVKVEKGCAELKLFTSGSFTIGAYVDKGGTELELDLAELPNVSDYFKTH